MISSSSMLDRRELLLAAAASMTACVTRPAAPAANSRTVSLATGAQGGGALAYGQAMAAVLGPTPLEVRVVETKGTAENINRLDARDVDAALLNMGAAWDAWKGKAPWADKPVRTMRALFPMYETVFHVVVSASAGITSIGQLAGKRVGVGPTGGTAEAFFRELLSATGLSVQVVNGSPSQHAQQLARGEIDAFWFGAGLPVPAFVEAAQLTRVRMFGLTASERTTFLKQFPYFLPFRVPALTYRGQTTALESVAVWNFAAVHRNAPEDLAYWLTRLTLSKRALLNERYPAASSTSASHLGANTFLPFHPGALRYYGELGVKVVSPPMGDRRLYG